MALQFVAIDNKNLDMRLKSCHIDSRNKIALLA